MTVAMDTLIYKFLNKNKLDHLLKAFEGLDYETFQKLKPHHIKSIIGDDIKSLIQFEAAYDTLPKHCRSYTIREEIPARNVYCAQDIMNIADLDLRIVLNKWHNTEAPLTTGEGTTISKAIIKHILMDNTERTLLRADFEKIAGAITEVFKTESPETFFIGASKGKVAKGKLWDSYNHYRHSLAEAGMIVRRKKTAKERSKNPEC